jgi:hypothetical protein
VWEESGVRSQESGGIKKKERKKKKKEEERNFLPPAPCLFYVRPRKKT